MRDIYRDRCPGIGGQTGGTKSPPLRGALSHPLSLPRQLVLRGHSWKRENNENEQDQNSRGYGALSCGFNTR